MTGPSMKGVTGWSFHKQRAVVAWKATNQTIVSLFSTEAELIAVDEATRELRFLHNLLLDFDIDVDMSTRIAQDNQSTIALVESKHFNARTKHVALRYHHTAEQQREGVLKVEYQPTERHASGRSHEGATAGSASETCECAARQNALQVDSN